MNVISIEPRSVHERFYVRKAVPRCHDHRPPDLGRALVHRQHQLTALNPLRKSSEGGGGDDEEEEEEGSQSEKKNVARGSGRAKTKAGRSSPTKSPTKQATKQTSLTRHKRLLKRQSSSSSERAGQKYRSSRELLKYGDGFDPLRGLFASRYHESSPRDILHTPAFAARMVRSDWSFSKCALLLYRNELLSSSQRQAATVVSTVYKTFQDHGLRLLRLFQFACATSSQPELDPMVIGQSDFVTFCKACGFTQKRTFVVKPAEAGQSQSSITSLLNATTGSQSVTGTGSERRVRL